jgi:uncharacterized protein with GYD domain
LSVAGQIEDSCERAAAFKATARKMGVKVTGQYWTLGAFDGVIVCEAPDEVTAVLLHLGTLGNIRTQTARAYDAAEMQKVLGLLPPMKTCVRALRCRPHFQEKTISSPSPTPTDLHFSPRGHCRDHSSFISPPPKKA